MANPSYGHTLKPTKKSRLAALFIPLLLLLIALNFLGAVNAAKPNPSHGPVGSAETVNPTGKAAAANPGSAATSQTAPSIRTITPVVVPSVLGFGVPNNGLVTPQVEPNNTPNVAGSGAG